MRKFNIGDEVVLRNDLVVGIEYCEMCFLQAMNDFKGITGKVLDITSSDNYVVDFGEIDEYNFIYSWEMLENYKGDNFMKIEDIKVGYLVEMASGTLGIVCENDEIGKFYITADGAWSYLSNDEFGQDLICSWDSNKAIQAVYGYAGLYINHFKIDKGSRECLWKRETLKEMSIEEIEEILGYKIKVIGGGK